MKNFIETLFQDVRHDLFSISLLSLTDPNKLKETGFMDYEMIIVKYFTLEKLH